MAQLERGTLVRFNNERDGGPVRRIASVAPDGMVELEDMYGFFAPHLFEIADCLRRTPRELDAIVDKYEMTPELFRQVGEALYGLEWRMPLSRELDVNYLTIRRWQSGAAPIPEGVVSDLRRLLGEAIAATNSRTGALRAALTAINTGGKRS